MTIQPIVEGHGEVAAVPCLLRRLLAEANLSSQIQVGEPIRRKRSEFMRETGVRLMVQIARRRRDCSAILILFDADEDCPRTLKDSIEKWARDEDSRIPCHVVLAVKEYEAWFLAALESLRGVSGISRDAVSHPQPESVAGAAERLRKQMPQNRTYSKPVDQHELTKNFELAETYRRCRSFRRMTHVVGLLAFDIGVSLETWPPPEWSRPGVDEQSRFNEGGA